MGAACVGGGDGAAYATADPSARLSPEATHALVVEKLQTSLFSGLLSSAQLEEFAKFFTIKTFPPEALIIKKGAQLDALYVVGEGEIRMEVGDDSAPGGSGGGPRPLGRQGSMASLATGSATTVTGVASSSGSAVGGAATVSRKGRNSMGGPNALAARNLLCIKKTGGHFAEGMLLEGKAGLHDLNVLVSGEEPAMLLVLSRASYHGDYVKKHPEMAAIVRSVAMSMEKQLQQLEFFQGIDNMKMKMLVTMFTFVPLIQDAILFHENDFDREHGNSLYFLYKGRVKVLNVEKHARAAGGAAAGERRGSSGGGGSLGGGLEEVQMVLEQKTLNTLEPNCFLGEVSLMLDIPRTATIQAVESCLLLELSQKNFRHFITIVPEILTKFNAVLLEYNIHLRYFIHNPFVLSYFANFCKSEFSTENIEFWMACRDFHKLDPALGKQDEIDQRAAEIKKIYIGNSAEQQVNLKGSVENKIYKALKEVPIKNTVFLDAEDEILNLMSSDSFGRFKSSDLFKTCIETVNSPFTAILRKLYLL